MEKKTKKITDSKPTIMKDAREVTAKINSAHQRILVTLMLRFSLSAKNLGEHERLLHQFPYQHMDHDTFQSNFGADTDDIDKVKQFAAQNELDVVHIDISGRAVTVEGTIDTVSRAFLVNLKQYEHPDYPGHRYHAHEDLISVPEEIHHIVTGVFGLNGQPLLKHHTRATTPGTLEKEHVGSPSATFNIIELPKFYNFPRELTGKGQKVAVFAAGGGYDRKEMQYYFENIASVPMPKITAIDVGKGTNNPNTDNINFDIEVSEDLQVLGTIAHGADIAIYFTTNDEHGFLDALRKMVFDKERNNSVITVSFGSSEPSIAGHWPDALLKEVNNVLIAASLLGITVCVAAGDLGSCAGDKDGKPHAYFPASSPYVLACGGTMFQYCGDKIISEVTWKETILDPHTGKEIHMASAGGVSEMCSMPKYQENAGITADVSTDANKALSNNTGRLLPDVAGYASLLRGYKLYLKGEIFPGGATSGVSPLYAALFALINQKLAAAGKQRIGFINPLLYQIGKNNTGQIFTDITEGNNDVNSIGVYGAGPGWDCCTGWGIIDGTKLMDYLLEHQPNAES